MINYIFERISYVLFSVLFFSCSESKQEVNTQVNAKSSQDSIYVETGSFDSESLQIWIEASGVFKARFEQILFVPRSGKITFCKVQNGEVVNEGDLLLQLDNREIQLKQRKVENSLFNSRLNYESELLNQESLLKGKSKGVIDTVKRKLMISTGITENQILKEELEIELSNNQIKAPFLGKLYDIHYKPGMTIMAGESFAKIYTHDDLIFQAQILESDVGAVSVGNEAIVTTLSGNKYKGFISQISPIVDQTGMQNLLIKINSNQPTIGMKGICEILTERKKGLFVPKTAIVIRNGRQVVFTVNGNKAVWNYVTTGNEVNNMIEITDGLKKQEEIIISNNSHLNHDSPIKIINNDQVLN